MSGLAGVTSVRQWLWRVCAASWTFSILGLLASGPAVVAGTWLSLNHTAPGSVGLMLLLPDGTVMAQNSGTSRTWYRLAPDINGSYVNGTWTTLASMHDTRLYFSSDVLRDGRVFVAGGEYGTGRKTAEVYDPLANAWKMAPVSGQSFSDSVSKVIANGNVLVAPVGPSSSGFTIIYNILSDTWITGPKLFRGSYQDEASWVKLPDNSILTIDPFGMNSERYIPASNTWINDSPVPVALYDSFGSELGGALLLPDGRAFFLGSTGHSAYYTPSGTTSPGTWSAGPDIPNAMGTPDAAAAMMVNGRILCAVSPVPTSGDHFPSPTSFYEFDYLASTFTLVNAPTGATENNASFVTTMLDLPDGTVLFSHFNSQLYVYRPAGAPLAAGKPVISNITQNADSTFHLTGTGLNGITEGAVYGDDWQMDSNYPIVRLTDSSNHVFYARTIRWSSTGVMTGNALVSTDFVLPAGLPAGAYSLVVVANGNSSDPVTFNVEPIVLTHVGSATEGVSPITATLTLPSAPASDQVVNLTSSLPARATVPPTVTVPAGQTSTTFQITVIDDTILNGSQAVMLSASADGYQGGLSYIVIKDNESATLAITPSSSLNSTGVYGGPFSPPSASYVLTNTGNIVLSWSATKSVSWLTLSPASGLLQPGSNTAVTATINSGANTLDTGDHTDTIIFNNTTNGNGNTSRSVSLTVTGAPSMKVSAAGVMASGIVGGPFSPPSTTLTVSNIGNAPLGWGVGKTASWLTLSTSGGSILPGASSSLTVSINSGANSLAVGTYNDTLSFTNKTNNVGNTTRPVALTVNAPLPVLRVTPAGGLSASGPFGGPFVSSGATFTISNIGNATMNWSASKTATWLTLSSSGGALVSGGRTTISASINASAGSQPVGLYTDTISFTNLNTGAGNTNRGATLAVLPAAPVLMAEPPFTAGDTNLVAWDNVTGATSYEAQLAATVDFASPLSTQTVAITSVTFSNLASGAGYYYRTRAFADSLASAWSSPVSSVQDAVPPNLDIGLPLNAYTTHSNLLVAGTASDALAGVDSVILDGLAVATTNGFTNWNVTVPLDLGSNMLTAIATDNAQSPGNQALLVQTPVRLANTTGDGLPDDWKIAHQLDPMSSEGDNGPLGDPDHDGRPNLLEYAFNTDPQQPDSDPIRAWIEINPTDGLPYCLCSFPRRIGAVDLSYQLEMSDDLILWTYSPAQLDQVSVSLNPDQVTETLTLRIKPATVPGAQNFFRVRVDFQ